MNTSLHFQPLRFPFKKFGANSSSPSLHNPSIARKSSTVTCCTRPDNSQNQQQLNLSVLRFTLGIRGLDESYLPRWLGYGFGSLLVLNHFVGSDASYITPAQFRTEALGLSLAAFSVVLPSLGKFLKGATSVVQAIIPEDAEQVFIMSQNISDTIKEDLAWGSYILLRNTSTISVLISIQDAFCVRGYWNTPKDKDFSKVRALGWFDEQIRRIGLYDLKDSLYFPQSTDSELWEMLPKGTRSLLVLPILQASDKGTNASEKTEGFVLLASSISYGYNTKDRAWIAAIANKLRRVITCLNDGTVFLSHSKSCLLSLNLAHHVCKIVCCNFQSLKGQTLKIGFQNGECGEYCSYKNFSKPYTRFCKEIDRCISESWKMRLEKLH